MNDHSTPGKDVDLERIEELLGEVTAADAHRVDVPPDLWDRIEAEVRPGDDRADIVVLNQRRRFPRRVAAIGTAAAAAVIILVGVVVAAIARDGDGATVVASAELAFDPVEFDELGADAAARVTLVDDDGTLHLEVDEAALPDPADEQADLELWLIEPDDDGNPVRLVSLGLIEPGDRRSYDVPATFDPEVYDVVDISVEPRDGDPDHSGRSILRGRLTRT